MTEVTQSVSSQSVINNIANSIKSIKSDNIIGTKENVNIYYIYHEVNKNIYNINMKLKEASDELEKLIQEGGPQDVKAQTYDQSEIKGSRKITPEHIYYAQIVDATKKIRKIEARLDAANAAKRKVEGTILDLAKLSHRNIELAVFIEHHMKHHSLYDISKRLYRQDEEGHKKHYDYCYIRQVNMALKRKMRAGSEKF